MVSTLAHSRSARRGEGEDEDAWSSCPWSSTVPVVVVVYTYARVAWAFKRWLASSSSSSSTMRARVREALVTFATDRECRARVMGRAAARGAADGDARGTAEADARGFDDADDGDDGGGGGDDTELLRGSARASLSSSSGTASSGTAAALKKVLTRKDLTLLGVGGIVGAGVFVLTGAVAHDHAGPAVVMSYILAASTSAVTGLAYAEFAVSMPVAGSAYNYMMATFGELAAFLTGCNLALELTIASAAVARGWTSYAVALFGGSPNATRLIVWPDVVEIDVVAGAVVAAMTALLVSGAKETAKFNSVVTYISLAVIATVIIAGSTAIDADNWTPFAPNGAAGIISGASVVIFAFVGFDTIATCAEEVANPSADLPFGILVSLGICASLYALMCLVITGMVPYSSIDVHAPFAMAFQTHNLHWVSSIVSVGAIAAITTSLLLSMMGQPRIFMVLSRDGLLPAWFADVSKRFGTPANASLFSGAVTGILGVVLDINLLAQLVSIGTLSIFCGVNLGLIVSRWTPKRATWAQRLPPLKRAAALLLSCFAFAIDYRARNARVSWFGALSLVAVIASTASFKTIPMVNAPPPTRFAAPFVPVLPAFGVLLTSILIAGLGALAIVRYVVYTTVCAVAYIVFATSRVISADHHHLGPPPPRPGAFRPSAPAIEMPRLDADRPVRVDADRAADALGDRRGA